MKKDIHTSDKNEKKIDKSLEKTEKSKDQLKELLMEIEDQFGEGTRLLGEYTTHQNEEVYSTGSIQLDMNIGGGVPSGRITEIYGPEGCGKTTLALSIIAQAQKKGSSCAFIDVEHALNREYVSNLGIDFQKLIVSQPNSGESAFGICERLVKNADKVNITVIVIDSVAALIPKSEIDGEVGDTVIGAQARLISHSLKRIIPLISQKKVALVFINQIRNKIGVMFGNPETTTGGFALKYYSSLRLELRKKQLIKNNSGEVIGHEVDAKSVKNRRFTPYINTYFELLYGKGINIISEIFELAIKFGILNRNGSWISYEGNNLAQGKDNFLKYLILNKNFLQVIVKKCNDIKEISNHCNLSNYIFN